ncbi:AAA-like domain protein [Variovorax sp. SRS16]|uniref:hypothetical protein n=1 Tax=Variovorax sp. SRS16 TaxID=282217 RepID=UPI00131781D8|nr:hypothetical protein [Variovorax sp. SRS16]VTU20749.1 AAA-like domain protein [Variovorax sp. SRS16]
MDNSNKPNLRLYCGATGSGKGVSLREYLSGLKPSRLLVWDPLGEYGDLVSGATSRLADVAKLAAGKSFRVAFYPGPDVGTYKEKFAMFCRIAFAAGNLVMLVEELADVTSPTYAPMAWKQCTKKGRHAGLQIIAATQRPADIDKHFLGGCTYIRCFTQRFPADAKAMAGAMKLPFDTINALETREEGSVTVLSWIEKDFRTGKTTPGSKRMQGK